MKQILNFDNPNVVLKYLNVVRISACSNVNATKVGFVNQKRVILPLV